MTIASRAGNSTIVFQRIYKAASQDIAPNDTKPSTVSAKRQTLRRNMLSPQWQLSTMQSELKKKTINKCLRLSCQCSSSTSSLGTVFLSCRSTARALENCLGHLHQGHSALSKGI